MALAERGGSSRRERLARREGESCGWWLTMLSVLVADKRKAQQCDGGFHSVLASVFCVGGERQRERMAMSPYFVRVWQLG
jgi:hypothetical protein